MRGSSDHKCVTTQYKRTYNEHGNGFIENVMISVTENINGRIMSLLESEVVSVLETLVKTTVNEMAKVVDSSGITLPPQTHATADKSVTLDFTVSVLKVHGICVFLLAAFVFKLYFITCMI